jgi:hypothetical protein
MRPTEYEVRDHRTDIIPLDVCFDPETQIGQINGYRVQQDGDTITVTLEMARYLVLAIQKMEMSRPERVEKQWQENWVEPGATQPTAQS